MTRKTVKRKDDHVKICLTENVESIFKTTGFEDIDFVHVAVPEINYEDLDISTFFLGVHLEAPIMITAMTGGSESTRKLNLNMARVAQKFGIAYSVGSQRSAIEDSMVIDTYKVREVAPDILLVGNIGLSQIAAGYGIDQLKATLETIDADALSVHMNVLQELVQPEGEPRYRGALEKLSALCKNLGYPVIAKETGCGINLDVAKKLVKSGVSAIDVSGAGGTSWSAVESYRRGGPPLCLDLWDWGIPTAVCTAEVARGVNVPLISSGGIRSGVDAAKAIALGADIVGIALPVLRALSSKDGLESFLKNFIFELKAAILLTGCQTVGDLRKVPLMITGRTREWMESRGIDVSAVRAARK
ncbi:MAG: type 2 isopentenyl-diphosphate Delta-isomerase [Candidatus Hadarchaeales archaeon]